MEEKYKLISELLKNKSSIFEHKSNGWQSYEHKTEPTMFDLLVMMDKLIQKHPRNINKILENIPEEEIQKYLRAKKMAKIQGK